MYICFEEKKSKARYAQAVNLEAERIRPCKIGRIRSDTSRIRSVKSRIRSVGAGYAQVSVRGHRAGYAQAFIFSSHASFVWFCVIGVPFSWCGRIRSWVGRIRSGAGYAQAEAGYAQAGAGYAQARILGLTYFKILALTYPYYNIKMHA